MKRRIGCSNVMANNTREGGHRKVLRYVKANRLKQQKTQAIDQGTITQLK